MAINSNTDDGGDDLYGYGAGMRAKESEGQLPGDQLPGDIEQQRAEQGAENERLLNELAPATPPEMPSDGTEESDLLDELAGPSSEPKRPRSPTEEIADVPLRDTPAAAPAAEKPPRGRYYVPPSQRTPQNRQGRREAVQARAAEQPTLQGFLEQGGQAPDAADGQDRQSTDLSEAFFRLGSAQNDAILELIRRVDRLTEALESARL